MERFDCGSAEPHRPVLYQEIINALSPASPDRLVDATLGAGGHAAGLLAASAPDGQLLGMDVDPQALALARNRLDMYAARAHLVQASYTTLSAQVRSLGWENVQGIVADLGVSSMQVDTADRGFSFSKDGRLDMRFDQRQAVTAGDLVNSLPENDLADLIWRYGEEKLARRIARHIILARPLEGTLELAAVISRAAGGKHQRIHPATRTFQALRIAVNQELQAIEVFLPQAIDILAPGGRLAVISFHSLEDRLIKQFFRREARDCLCPPEAPVCTCGHKARIKEITRKPIEASAEEISANPRSRSAKLRVAQKIE